MVTGIEQDIDTPMRQNDNRQGKLSGARTKPIIYLATELGQEMKSYPYTFMLFHTRNNLLNLFPANKAEFMLGGIKFDMAVWTWNNRKIFKIERKR